jgi:pectate lyase
MNQRWLALLLAASSAGCSSAPTQVPLEDMVVDGEPSAPVTPPVFDEAALGWASVPDGPLMGTTGGEGGQVVTATTTAELSMYAKMAGPLVILVSGVIGEGSRVSITSNHTVIGLPGAEFHGGLKVSGAVNVIIRNLKIVGNNCADSPTDCSGGADALSISDSSHHIWVDHCDISDGSDGNLDVNDGSDFVTISWTKFSYSGVRPGGHQFSNLVGSSDNEPGDAGHLRVTYHHNWWADNIDERMPRVRYGQVHLLNNLYTSTGNSYCVGLGYFANILTEGNVFFQVRNPIESRSYANEQSVVVSHDNLYVASPGTNQDRGSAVFVPPYAYQPDRASDVKAAVENGAGVCNPRFRFIAEPIPSCTASSDPGPSSP